MSWSIYHFTPDLYGGIADVHNVIYPENPCTPAELRSTDERSHRVAGFRRWAVVADKQVVAYAEHGPALRSPDPCTFWAEIIVHPTWQRRGIGTALYDLTIRSLHRFQPRSLRIWTRDDLIQSIAFLERRGFREVMRTWDSRLDVTTFDVAPYARIVDRLTAEGIGTRTAHELQDDPDRDRALYDLYREIHYDVPRPGPRVPDTYEEFVRKHLTASDRACFIALQAEQYVGMHLLAHRPESEGLYIEMTGVKRAYRRRGIATALKLRGIMYARDHGITTLKTFNESNNRGILAINERLGFVRMRATVDFIKEWTAAR